MADPDSELGKAASLGRESWVFAAQTLISIESSQTRPERSGSVNREAAQRSAAAAFGWTCLGTVAGGASI
jgi:hypothetical protein